MRIGFCGVGLMGSAMVSRLLAAGFDLMLWNRTASRIEPFRQRGVAVAAVPAELSAAADVVILCLFDALAVEEVVFGAEGIASSGRSVLLIDHSTISPAATREISSRLATSPGATWIDAPVSGGVQGASAGALTIMAGGDVRSIETATPILSAYAARVVRVGDVGAGQTAKFCNQAIVSATILAIAEAVVLAQRAGLDPRVLTQALEGGWADSRLLKLFVPRMTSDPADVIGTIETLKKDATAIAALSVQSGAPLPLNSAVAAWLSDAVARGMGSADISRIGRLLAADA